MEVYFIIIALALIFGIFPILGRKIYGMSTKKIISVYFIGIAGLFAINIAFTGTFNPSRAVEIILIYWNLTISVEVLFFFMFGFFLIGGLGLFGSLAELSSEMIEDSNLFADLKKRTTPKSYIAYLLYGYLFIFGIFAANKILLILLGIDYKPIFLWFETLFQALQFESIIVVIIGITLFSIKAFRFGYFSKEFWKSNLTYQEKRDTWYRYTRKFFVVFFYSWGLYTAFILSFIDLYGLSTPFEYGGLDSIRLIFYLATFIESIYFYKNKSQLVHHLKTQREDFAKKVDESIKIVDLEEKKKNTMDDEIKFQ